MVSVVEEFVSVAPTDKDYLRGIVLFGRNVASYKFALAKSILEFAAEGREAVTIADLAVPFSRHICEHLATAPKQSTSKTSEFLTKCRSFNAGEIGQDELIKETTRLGFVNVIDAFHNIGGGELPTRFFEDRRSEPTPMITLTANALNLGPNNTPDLLDEVEARWALVETAWALGLSRYSIEYDNQTGFLTTSARRRSVTVARDALNGYQKGKCFYCFCPIGVQSGASNLAEVDHLFPHVLQRRQVLQNLDGVWNLVLACETCNRGPRGKHASIPHKNYVERLHRRNEYLIASHHPLRETLIQQTGQSAYTRKAFLQSTLSAAQIANPTQPWSTTPTDDPIL